MKYCKFSDLIGKKIGYLRGYPHRFSTEELKRIQMRFILFDDGETIVEFGEQDPYDHHDCSQYAWHVDIYADEKRWKKLHDELDEPTEGF